MGLIDAAEAAIRATVSDADPKSPRVGHPPTEWYVTYSVEGYGVQTAGPYACEHEAQSQADDIRGYEGVSMVRVKPAEEVRRG